MRVDKRVHNLSPMLYKYLRSGDKYALSEAYGTHVLKRGATTSGRPDVKLCTGERTCCQKKDTVVFIVTPKPGVYVPGNEAQEELIRNADYFSCLDDFERLEITEIKDAIRESSDLDILFNAPVLVRVYKKFDINKIMNELVDDVLQCFRDTHEGYEEPWLKHPNDKKEPSYRKHTELTARRFVELAIQDLGVWHCDEIATLIVKPHDLFLPEERGFIFRKQPEYFQLLHKGLL